MPRALTDAHHASQAIRFDAATNVYLAIGRTTAWPNESEPPTPTGQETVIDEVIGYKPAALSLVKPDGGGAISWGGQTWTEVQPEDAVDENAQYVWVHATIEYDELPLTTFRQVGLYTGLTKAGGAGSGALLPGEVTDPGVLEAIDNREPEPRYIDKRNQIGFVIRL